MATEVWAVAMVRDEADIIESSVRRMVDHVDRVLVCDNGSTDGTRELLERLDVELVDDPDPAYYQSQKMTRLAALAAGMGASWILPFDADEAWYSPFGRIADVLAEHPDACIAPAAVYDHVATARDPIGEPMTAMGWRRHQPGPLPKVACRAALPVTIEQGNHGACYPQERPEGLLVVRHFPYRSPAQMVRKARNGAEAYAATDLPEDQGKHWRDYGRLIESQGPEALEDVFRRYFWSPEPDADPALIFDPAP